MVGPSPLPVDEGDAGADGAGAGVGALGKVCAYGRASSPSTAVTMPSSACGIDTGPVRPR